MIHVIMDEQLFGVSDRAFHGLHLLGYIETWPPILYHGDDRAQVPFGTFQPGHHLGMTCMSMGLCHRKKLSSRGG